MEKNKNDSVEVIFYQQIGKIFAICGTASLIILSFVLQLPQDYEKYNISMFVTIWIVISFILLVVGVEIIFLAKYNKKFKKVIKKDFNKFIEKDIEKNK